MKKDQLLARAQELQIEVPEGATNKEISNLIKIAEHPQLVADLATANAELASLRKAYDDLANNKIASTSETEKGAVYKTTDGVYELKVKSFRYKGQKYKAEEAVKDEALMDELIAAKFVHLKKA
ncbi:hypothetical protein [Leptobacterium sp. I13]|uniref:hypothetical protein n=1 Tax=Leptobacterium meishanense TaxID=3128904 RepID=UPI0030EF6974